MMTNDIAFCVGGIGLLFLSDHLTMSAIMVVGVFRGLGKNQRMIITINMVMRP